MCQKNLKNQTLLVETSRKSQSENLLKMKQFFNIPVTVSEHTTLNSSPWRVPTTLPRSLGHTSHRGRY